LGREGRENLSYYQLANDSSLVHQVCQALYQLKIQSVLVEGGARLLQSFIDEGYWDEARVITNNELELPGGLPAPVLSGVKGGEEFLFSDTIRYYKNL
jgi:diaminohydroxyphosphoribosylaminopyrimidine deaminase/5-amino-6-(5-phosphoribosylamino)uracil reductase